MVYMRFYRYVLFAATVVLAGGMFCCADAGQQLRLLTSFPPRFYTPFIERFETLNPDISVSILNKKTTAALDEILRGNDRSFDLFWSSSIDAFDILKSKQMLSRLDHKQPEPTILLDNVNLSDPEGYYWGFAVSGIGWMWNTRYLEKEKLPVPQRWEDLEKPIYYGHLAMSTPSRSGTTHLIVENILQKYGWDRGWAYLMRISGNFSTITARSFGVPEGVESSRFGIGLVIDFLARTNTNDNIGFSYAKPAFPVPAAIARLSNSANRNAAERFIDFILSYEGQQILLQPEINRLPVHRNLLINRQDKVRKLLQLIDGKELQTYDIKLSHQRYHLVNKLFDQTITFHLRKRRQLWKRLILLEARLGADSQGLKDLRKAVLKLVSAVPVSHRQSLDPELKALMGRQAFGQDDYEKQRQLVESWDDFIRQRFSRAKTLIDAMESRLNKGGQP